MPELPDILVYLDALDEFIGGQTLLRVSVRSPFLLRSIDPPLESFEGQRVLGFERLGKQIAWRFEKDRFLLFHLMIAGRFHWRKPGTRPRGKNDLAAFAFDAGVMMLTEASKKQRASLHAVEGREALEAFRQGGANLEDCDLDRFTALMTARNRTLKRALTDPRLIDGIGNAYSDEILHAARLSPVQLTQRLDGEQMERLFEAAKATLKRWTERLNAARKKRFPEKVTAFRPEMAAHGKFGEPCPECGTIIQRIVYSENETNYCPGCQTGGKLLADRSLSRLLKDDWPKKI